MARVNAGLLTLAAAAALVGCAHAPQVHEWGAPGLVTEGYFALDSVLDTHIGQRVAIRTKDSVGMIRPARGMQALYSFRGILLGHEEGYVDLLRSSQDTLRVGKASIIEVRLQRGSNHLSPFATVAGAVLGGFLGYMVATKAGTTDPANPATTRWAVGGGALGGALLAALINRAEREGPRIYPAPKPRERRGLPP